MPASVTPIARARRRRNRKYRVSASAPGAGTRAARAPFAGRVARTREPMRPPRAGEERKVEGDVVTDDVGGENRLGVADQALDRRGAADHGVREAVDRRGLGRNRPAGADERHVAWTGDALDEPDRRRRDDGIPAGIEAPRLRVEGEEAPPHRGDRRPLPDGRPRALADQRPRGAIADGPVIGLRNEVRGESLADRARVSSRPRLTPPCRVGAGGPPRS